MSPRRAILLAFALTLGLTFGWAPAVASGQESDPSSSSTSSTTSSTAVPTQDIIPQPNSGVEPTDAGDRGGALQTVLFVLIIAGIGVIGYLVVRESRKARADRGF